MAIMIPSVCEDFQPNSHEDLMYDALKNLPDDYYVFYSLRIDHTDNTTLIKENEIDFVVYNRIKGLLFLEAKAGKYISYTNGEWYYSNGKRMSHQGPFNQARQNMYNLNDWIKKHYYMDYMDKCNFMFGVWFPMMSKKDIESIDFPRDCPPELVMTAEALENPLNAITTVMNHKLNSDKKRKGLTVEEEEFLLNKVLFPEFEIFQTPSGGKIVNEIQFKRLLKEQSKILNFLEDQKTAAISGVAGTGKTLIALERAKRMATSKDRVLFLCFNKLLKNKIETSNQNKYIDFYTVDGFACKLAGTKEANYIKATEIVWNQAGNDIFPYKHIVIDEGQDFGRDAISKSGFVDALQSAIEMQDGSMYVFYDKLQMIQADEMADFIKNADCKVTLYKNCRNTYNIASTSMKPITAKKPILRDGVVEGETPRLNFCKEKELEERLDKIINKIESAGYSDIVVLTCKTIESSAFKNFVSNNLYKNKTAFYTCRTFKGLEADAVVVVDVDKETFIDTSGDNNRGEIFYVGASRARFSLDILTCMNEDDCKLIISQNPPAYPVGNYRKEVAKYLGANGIAK